MYKLSTNIDEFMRACVKKMANKNRTGSTSVLWVFTDFGFYLLLLSSVSRFEERNENETRERERERERERVFEEVKPDLKVIVTTYLSIYL